MVIYQGRRRGVVGGGTPTSLQNAGFEQNVGSNPSSVGGKVYFRPTGLGWEFLGNAGIMLNGSAYGNPNAPEGSQAILLQNNGLGATIARQTVSMSGTYKITFKVAGRTNGGGIPQITVKVDGNIVKQFVPNWASYTLVETNEFTVSNGGHVISFEANSSGDSTAFIDDVQIIPVA